MDSNYGKNVENIKWLKFVTELGCLLGLDQQGQGTYITLRLHISPPTNNKKRACRSFVLPFQLLYVKIPLHIKKDQSLWFAFLRAQNRQHLRQHSHSKHLSQEPCHLQITALMQTPPVGCPTERQTAMSVRPCISLSCSETKYKRRPPSQMWKRCFQHTW